MELNLFANTFITELNQKMATKKDLMATYRQENREDDSNLVKIELNVMDIFIKMFNVAKSKVPQTLATAGWRDPLKAEFLPFFDKITTPWADRLEKCKAHDLHEDIHIETLKLETAAAIKTAFMAAIEER